MGSNRRTCCSYHTTPTSAWIQKWDRITSISPFRPSSSTMMRRDRTHIQAVFRPLPLVWDCWGTASLGGPCDGKGERSRVLLAPFSIYSLNCLRAQLGRIYGQRRKPTLGGRLLFLSVSDRGVSCLGQLHSGAPRAVVDWNWIRRCLDGD
jgi:hypothetical protein